MRDQELMRVKIELGQRYETIDTPEGVGPWIARMVAVLKPAPGGYFRCEVF